MFQLIIHTDQALFPGPAAGKLHTVNHRAVLQENSRHEPLEANRPESPLTCFICILTLTEPSLYLSHPPCSNSNPIRVVPLLGLEERQLLPSISRSRAAAAYRFNASWETAMGVGGGEGEVEADGETVREDCNCTPAQRLTDKNLVI